MRRLFFLGSKLFLNQCEEKEENVKKIENVYLANTKPSFFKFGM